MGFQILDPKLIKKQATIKLSAEDLTAVKTVLYICVMYFATTLTGSALFVLKRGPEIGTSPNAEVNTFIDDVIRLVTMSNNCFTLFFYLRGARFRYVFLARYMKLRK